MLEENDVWAECRRFSRGRSPYSSTSRSQSPHDPNTYLHYRSTGSWFHLLFFALIVSPTINQPPWVFLSSLRNMQKSGIKQRKRMEWGWPRHRMPRMVQCKSTIPRNNITSYQARRSWPPFSFKSPPDADIPKACKTPDK